MEHTWSYPSTSADDIGTVELRTGAYVATLHSPDKDYTSGFIALEKQGSTGTLRLLHSGCLDACMRDTHPQRIAGRLLRSLRTQWTDTALSLLLHLEGYGCTSWCGAACPAQPYTQQAHTQP